VISVWLSAVLVVPGSALTAVVWQQGGHLASKQVSLALRLETKVDTEHLQWSN